MQGLVLTGSRFRRPLSSVSGSMYLSGGGFPIAINTILNVSFVIATVSIVFGIFSKCTCLTNQSQSVINSPNLNESGCRLRNTPFRRLGGGHCSHTFTPPSHDNPSALHNYSPPYIRPHPSTQLGRYLGRINVLSYVLPNKWNCSRFSVSSLAPVNSTLIRLSPHKHTHRHRHPILSLAAPYSFTPNVNTATSPVSRVASSIQNSENPGSVERMSMLKSLSDRTEVKYQADDWTPSQPLIEIRGLQAVAVENDMPILKGVDLTIVMGETHAIMGRNGSGKSTLAKVLAGHPAYRMTGGEIKYKGLDLQDMSVTARAVAGIFLAFQYPIEIPMLRNSEMLRSALNEQRRQRQEEEVDALEFTGLMYEKLQMVGLGADFIDRPVNYGFSGGEKKRNEIMQMLLLSPSLALLDETDSGLDVDSFEITAKAVAKFAAPYRSFLIITHYKKLLDMIPPHQVHVMHEGRIIKTGTIKVASDIESKGFAQYVE